MPKKKSVPVNQIIHANCIDGMRELPDDSIPLVSRVPHTGICDSTMAT